MAKLRTTLRRIRNRVCECPEYFSSIDEMRTRYGLVDPTLRALGWHTDDPTSVRVEYDMPNSSEKVDYALIGDDSIAIVESKKLDPDKAEPFSIAWKAEQSAKPEQLTRAWKHFADPTAPPPIKSTMRVIYDEDWRQSRFIRAHEDQLESYVDALGMEAGYAVLTDGDEWHIFDLAQRSGSLSQSPAISTSILFSLDTDEVVAALDTISR